MRWIALLLMLSGTAAAEVRPVGGSQVQVRLHGRLSPGIGLRPQKGIWSLKLAGYEGAAELEFSDVTAGAGAAKWVITAAKDRVELDPERFMPGHTYRLLVRRVGAAADTFYVYLYPGKGEKSSPGRVNFSDDDTGNAVTDDEIAVLPKGAL